MEIVEVAVGVTDTEGDMEMEGVMETVGGMEEVEETVGVLDPDRVAVLDAAAVTVGVAEDVPVTVRVAEVTDTVEVMEGVLVGVTLEVGLALKLPGAFTCTVPPLPRLPYLLSPQQETAPPVVSTHV